jgi:hypothetical protein
MAAIALLSAAIGGIFAQPADAADLQLHPHHHRHHARTYHHPYRVAVSYIHNYGPVEFWTDGVRAIPDRIIRPVGSPAFAYYDVNRPFCEQSTASYRGQDGRRYPCN